MNYQEEFSKKTKIAKIFKFFQKFITSDYKPNDHLKSFLKNISGCVVEIGSGNRRLRKDITNIDIEKFDNVDIKADFHKLPLKNETVDCIIADYVLEHVKYPSECVEEARRVLKHGGLFFARVPSVHIYHPYPKHYWNFTRDGLEILFKEFKNVEIGVECGGRRFAGPCF